ncbi:ABC transporter permease [Anaerocolumna xylanovorans]|uniref:ABC-type transport system, involved in lipoprotein release, permease component n=1 Tax=Anaerocolumna xylanovorans DSM 12503 TaxID=1121345 RepID=A0A1M7YNI1_9FIRM|nr:ABC transporter permease [Anaerocolumna xylanovorans]SHO54190.1 ABC-type transport system, involved in lipoprotein release, permease component [Anaerocolumna xylanovorans DSM 12503]
MKISDLIKIGLRNLKRRKARTTLTVMGVVIGTISIVVMISIGIGMKKSYTQQVMELGSLTEINVSSTGGYVDDKGNYISIKADPMDDELVTKIRDIPHVKTAVPMILTNIFLYSGHYQNNIQLYVLDSNYISGMDFPALTAGNLPSPKDTRVIVFGSDSLNNFYNPYSMFGSSKQIDITRDKLTFGFNPYQYQMDEKKKPLTVKVEQYGVLTKSNNYQFDYNGYMDINYFKYLYAKYVNTLKTTERKKAMTAVANYTNLKVTVDNFKNVEDVQAEIDALGYQTDSLAKLMAPMLSTANMLQMVLGAIGAVSMLVSAINIANTMIMSIYERTKEIGIMKVLGCLVRDVKKLFLFEAGMIGLIGGIIGIASSYAASWAINKFGGPLFQALMSTNYMYNPENSKFSIIPLWLPLVAAGLAIMVGIISGYYPASRATKISAIEAMKTEG